MSRLDFSLEGVTDEELLEAVLAKLQDRPLPNVSRSTIEALVAVLAAAATQKGV